MRRSPKASSAQRGRSRYSFRPFYVTVCLLSFFAVCSLAAHQIAQFRRGQDYGNIQRRAAAQLDAQRLWKRDVECRLVHYAEDKCEFIKLNCPDEEAGLFSYLSLYYCSLPNTPPVAFTILVLWLALLFSTIGIAASDFFCVNLSTISTILGMSESLAGVTFLAFGNGSPDVFSTFAAMSTHSGSLAIGELIGAAGFITAVVAGSMALVREFKVGKKTFVRDVGFFIVAASFSMIFLADGALHFWECCVMIGFYIFYVATVVTWHWYLTRRRRSRERDALARGHYIGVGTDEVEVLEENIDDEDAPTGENQSFLQVEDFDALERGVHPVPDDMAYGYDSDEDNDEGKMLAAEMSKSMRVTRPGRSRRNTSLNPIRPSLVGALEFRSVLSSLQKSRSISSRPIYLRRYSDDSRIPSDSLTAVPESDVSDHEGSFAVPRLDGSNEGLNQTEISAARVRAVSLNDATATENTPVPDVGIASATPVFPRYLDVPQSRSGPPSLAGGPSLPGNEVLVSRNLSVSPPLPSVDSRDINPAPAIDRPRYDERLAPPVSNFPGARHFRGDFFFSKEVRGSASPAESPRARSPRRPQLSIPASYEHSLGLISSPASPFPAYTDSPLPMTAQSSRAPSLLLPEPHIEDYPFAHDIMGTAKPRLIWWWPYNLLPDPCVMGAVLFPTLRNWRDKSIWDKFISIISAPSIFLLAITLPVVEGENKEEDEIDKERQRSRSQASLLPASPLLAPGEEPEWIRYRRSTMDQGAMAPKSPALQGLRGHASAATVAVSTEHLHEHGRMGLGFPKQNASLAPSSSHSDPEASSPGDWNRWLVIVQIFTAPLFVMLIIWANSSTDQLDPRLLLHLVLYSLLGSLIAYAILLLTTTRDEAPKYRPLLCFLGFVVSIAWISTIANEVVGVLKAFGVILGISDAILGLTIFAVGNSLGDLVADVTVARLGYPVMALSACFGGPMLNILLGIGVSGLYMTIKEANHKHKKHPGKPMRYKPYQIEVSGTLLISAIVLLITLVGLLIIVPLNRWMFTKKIGWTLIALWSFGTVVNVIVEMTGVWGDSVAL